MDATDVRAAAEQCARFLDGAVNADWSAPIPDMEWSVAQAVAHAAEGPLWYAFDLSAGEAEVTTMDLRVKPNSPPTQLVATLVAATRVVASVIETSPPSRRGFHPLWAGRPIGVRRDGLRRAADPYGRSRARAWPHLRARSRLMRPRVGTPLPGGAR